MHFTRLGEDVLFWFLKQITEQTQFGHPIGTGLIIAEVAYGFGRPAYYLTPHQFREFSKYAFGEWLQVRQAMFNLLDFQ